MATTNAPARALPHPYLAWLSGVTVSQLGDAVLAFALGWAAAGLGGTTAALMLALSGLPRLVLLIVGGAVADRVGARRILIIGESALLTLTAILALALAQIGTPTWLLLTTALALGTVTAFCLPATGSMPRRLVADDQLTRALALRQGLVQVVLLTAAPLSGLVVGAVGLSAVAWGTTVTFGVSLCVLIAVRELSGAAPDPSLAGVAGPARLDLVGGFRIVARTPELSSALALTGAGAALILPVPSLLVPLLGRSSGWGPATTGLVAGAVGVGAICAALLAARSRKIAPGTTDPADRSRALQVGCRSRPGSAATGLAVSAGGALVIAAGTLLGGSAATEVTVLGALVFGFGNGRFVARIAPLVLGSAPRTHLARVQALVGLVQLVPVMVTSTVLGTLAEHTSPHWALGVTAAGLVACAAWSGRSA
ncbi:MFS transporter [Oerskovia merdavium]|uniref:MFS transporter n=1 Tax=Oerskovia merdavium TaxID=2762227 RepID=A0ABR8U268_9CELL|nr:MFS transporter [Oerskovia merdavium]MBD7982137.1 MFS transporter [Oerskovia merdavium]